MHYCLNIPIQSHNWLENPPPDHQVSLPVSLVQVWLSWRKKAILRHYPEQLALLVECYYSGALRVDLFILNWALCSATIIAAAVLAVLISTLVDSLTLPASKAAADKV